MGKETRCSIETGCICDVLLLEKSATYSLRLEYETLWKQLNKGTFWCICLQERDDRYRESSDEFHKYGLCRLVEYYRPVRPSKEECAKRSVTRASWYGIWNSTKHVVSTSLARGESRCFSFEDDCRIYSSRMSVDKLRQLVDDAESLPEGWGVFKLGQCAQLGFPISLTVCRSLSWLCQAVLWSKDGMSALANTSYESYAQKKGREMEVDSWMMGAMTIYGCFPQLVHQSDSETSNYGLDDKWYRVNVMGMGRSILKRCDVLVDVVIHVLIPLVLVVLGIALLAAVYKYFRDVGMMVRNSKTDETLENQSFKTAKNDRNDSIPS